MSLVLNLKPVTKGDYERVLREFERARALPLSRIDRPAVLAWRKRAFAMHGRRFVPHSNSISAGPTASV